MISAALFVWQCGDPAFERLFTDAFKKESSDGATTESHASSDTAEQSDLASATTEEGVQKIKLVSVLSTVSGEEVEPDGASILGSSVI